MPRLDLIQMRRGTTTQWADADPVVLASGEIGVELDDSTGEVLGIRVGDGTRDWDELGVIYQPLATMSGCRAFLSNTDQAIPTSTHTAVNLNGENFDTGGYHDNVTDNSRLTIATTGYYICSAQARFDTNATGYRQLTVWKNGVVTGLRLGQHGPVPNNGVAATVRINMSTGLVPLAAGDYVELGVWHDRGTNLDVIHGQEDTWISLLRVA